MQAIRTRYLGPSNSKGARVQASCEAKTIYVSWDHELSVVDNHKAAAQELVRRMGWSHTYNHSGCYKHDYYHVCDR